MSKKRQIPLYESHIDKNEIANISRVINRKSYWALGPEIKDFEKRLASLSRTNFSLAFNSGTSAGHALMNYYGVRNSEVIVPSFTFVATSNVVLMEGGKPIFADIEEETFGLDPEDLKEKITNKTKVIMPIHYGGNVCKIREILEIAEDANIKVVEDASESLGATIDQRPVGSFGDSSWFSFAPNKTISTGEGGAITTSDEDLYSRSKLFRSHGREGDSKYFESNSIPDYVSLGYNFRMPSMNAALGNAQLDSLNEIIRKRRQVAAYYDLSFKNLEGLSVPKMKKGVKGVYQMYPILVNEGKAKRDKLQSYLMSKGISSRVYFEPVHHTLYYRNLGYGECKLPITNKISEKVLCLPIYPDLETEQQKFVIKSVTNFMEQVKNV